MPAENTGDGHPDVTATEARAGRPGVPVLWVLVVSTVVALIAVVVVWGFFSNSLAKRNESPQVTSKAVAASTDTPTVPASTQSVAKP